MQPIYLTGHQRPVRKVQYNYDGDLLFTCSDDGTICMYRTYDHLRVGNFVIKDACKSIDLSKDSKWMIAAGTTKGVFIYSIEDGSLKSQVKVPSILTKQVEFNTEDKKYLVVHDDKKKSFVKIYDFADSLENKDQAKIEVDIGAPQDHLITQASWGFLDKTIYISTDKGRFLIHDLENKETQIESDIHKGEIFSFTFTYDHSMLITCSKDGTAKLLNRNTLESYREFYLGRPCRSASISPLFDSKVCQKFHVLLAGGQDAKEVTTTQAKEGGFTIQLQSIIYNESLAEITGHFGTVHSLAFSPDGTSFASGAEDGYVHVHKFLPEYFTRKFD